MPTVIAVFDSAESLETALDRLGDEGFGDEIVREEAESEDATAPRDSDLGLAPGANQAGALTKLEPSSDLDRFELTEEEHDFLQRALQHGAEMVAVRTERVEEAVSLFQELGAQQIRDPR